MPNRNATTTAIEVEIIQPDDPTDPLYALVRRYTKGMQKQIAGELKVAQSAISNVRLGNRKSERIWKKLIAVTISRRAQEIEFLKYMNQPLPE